MQIFFLHSNPEECAKLLCDQHVVSECKELMQILTTVWALSSPINYYQYRSRGWLLKPWRAFKHPSIQWVMQSKSNYIWTVVFLHFCLMEFRFRNKKIHAYDKLADHLVCDMDIPPLPDVGFVRMSKEFQAISNKTLRDEDPTIGYRRFYNKEKHFASWTKGRDVPKWYRRET